MPKLSSGQLHTIDVEHMKYVKSLDAVSIDLIVKRNFEGFGSWDTLGSLYPQYRAKIDALRTYERENRTNLTPYASSLLGTDEQ